MIVINDALVQEVQVFKEQTNVFDEYLFSSFFFRPNCANMLGRVMRVMLRERFVDDAGQDRQERAIRKLSEAFLDILYPDFFNFVHTTLRLYTTSINEYVYFINFLYPEFLLPVVKLYLEYEDSSGKLPETHYLNRVQPSFCNTRAFRTLMQVMTQSLYIHAASKEDMHKMSENLDKK